MKVGCFPGRETFVVYELGKESLSITLQKSEKFSLKSLEEATNQCSSALEAVHSHAMQLMLDSARGASLLCYWPLVNKTPKTFSTSHLFHVLWEKESY